MKLNTWQDWAAVICGAGVMWLLLGLAVALLVGRMINTCPDGEPAAEFTLADAENINDYVDPEVVDDQPATRTPDELDSMIKSAISYQRQQQYWHDLADWEASR